MKVTHYSAPCKSRKAIPNPVDAHMIIVEVGGFKMQLETRWDGSLSLEFFDGPVTLHAAGYDTYIVQKVEKGFLGAK